MGVLDGQPVSAAVTNPAFLDANADDTAEGKISFDDQAANAGTVSGPAISNIQKNVNSIASFLGWAVNSLITALPTWATSNRGTGTDNIQDRIEAIDTGFAATEGAGGHVHDGTAGNGPKIAVTDLTGYRAADVTIANGATTVSVTFSSALGAATYGLSCTIFNNTDSMPIFLQWYVAGKSTTGFTLVLNAPTDSANYVLSYVALEAA